MDSERFVRRMMECAVHVDPSTRTWYIGVTRRTRAWVAMDYYRLDGKSVSGRVRDLIENGVPDLFVTEPLVTRKVAEIEYRLLDDGIVQMQYSEGNRDGWPRSFVSAQEGWLFLHMKLRDLELSVIQQMLSEDVV